MAMEWFEFDLPDGRVAGYRTRERAIEAAQALLIDHPVNVVMIYLNDKNDTLVSAAGVSRPDGGF